MKIQSLILKILEEEGELEAGAIRSKMIKHGEGLTYDTVSRHLKKMTEEGLLVREAKGKPWNYYYSLRKK